jgi:hypothetical protein
MMVRLLLCNAILALGASLNEIRCGTNNVSCWAGLQVFDGAGCSGNLKLSNRALSGECMDFDNSWGPIDGISMRLTCSKDLKNVSQVSYGCKNCSCAGEQVS